MEKEQSMNSENGRALADLTEKDVEGWRAWFAQMAHPTESVGGRQFNALCDLALSALRAQAPAQPVAWMWEYVGDDPYPRSRPPCARSLHEMDPHNNPYPDTWNPAYPLYVAPSSGKPAPEERELLREARNMLHERDGTYSRTKNVIKRIDALLSRPAAQDAVMVPRSLLNGCMSGVCQIKPPTGQHTNGGCRCLSRIKDWLTSAPDKGRA